jgi:hypothetical protein
MRKGVVMTNDPQPSVVSSLQALTTAPPGSRLGKWATAIRVAAIAVTAVGAAPTAMNLYHSYKNGIPYDQVSQALKQAELWRKNMECAGRLELRPLNTGAGTRIEAGSCPSSGDIQIKVVASNGKSSIAWIPLDEIQKGQAELIRKGPATQMLALLFPPAHAAGPAAPGAPAAGTSAVTPVQGAPIKVECQAMPTQQMIIRVVNEGGKCFREEFSPFQGKVMKRQEVPCTTKCT